MTISFQLFACLMTILLEQLKFADGGCPVGYDRLDACIGGECPNQNEAGRTYQCIGDDCCSPNNNAAAGGAGACNDNAINCALFIFHCQNPQYIQCMIQNCARTCGFCTPPATTG